MLDIALLHGLKVLNGDDCEYNWMVIGTRHNIEVEPLKHNTNVKGDGPYKYIVP